MGLNVLLLLLLTDYDPSFGSCRALPRDSTHQHAAQPDSLIIHGCPKPLVSAWRCLKAKVMHLESARKVGWCMLVHICFGDLLSGLCIYLEARVTLSLSRSGKNAFSKQNTGFKQVLAS